MNIDRICSCAHGVVADAAVRGPLHLLIVEDDLQDGENSVVFPIRPNLVIWSTFGGVIKVTCVREGCSYRDGLKKFP